MKHVLVFLHFSFIVSSLWAQIPKQGNDTLLDVAQWNIEWFGDTQNGPSNENLQYNNVKEVITRADIDLWSLCEVSDPTTFQKLITDLGNYSYTSATYSQTQKTALMWKSNMFDLLLSRHVLSETTYDYAFAGRPPLEVMLRRKDSVYQDTIIIYVVHLKALGDQLSYQRRKDALGFLKPFLDANRKNYKTLVMGDWNDLLYGSIYSGSTESPMKNFVNDSVNYLFMTKQLKEEGKGSYKSGSLIDHIMLNQACDSFYLKGKARVLDFLPSYISGYTSNTSDHYPVMGFFNFKRYLPEPIPNAVEEATSIMHRISVYPVPASNKLFLPETLEIASVEIYDAMGRIVMVTNDHTIDLTTLQAGYYTGKGYVKNQTVVFKFVKE